MKRTQIKKRPLTDSTIANLEPELKAHQEFDSKGFFELQNQRLDRQLGAPN